MPDSPAESQKHHPSKFRPHGLVLLVWFFGLLRGDDSWHFRRAPIRRKVALCWLAASVLAVDLLWLEVPGPASKTVGRDLADYKGQYTEAPALFMERIGWWAVSGPHAARRPRLDVRVG